MPSLQTSGSSQNQMSSIEEKIWPNWTLKQETMCSETPWNALLSSPHKPQSKEVEGKCWYWCQHCGFWQLSHGTLMHQNAPAAQPSSTLLLNFCYLYFEPSQSELSSNYGQCWCNMVGKQ